MLRYGLTIFLSALLLFQVQPLIARVILPWFGGTAAVWTACMLFFQTGLLLGYAYAHALRRWLSPFQGWLVHIVLLSGAAVFANPIPSPLLQPDGTETLLGGVWSILVVTIGLPFVALSATSPLLQAWQSETDPQRSPYPLYALSNVGSLLALVTYPLVVEPRLTTIQQGMIWQYGFLVFVCLCLASGHRLIDKRTWTTGLWSQDYPNKKPILIQDATRTSGWRRFAWLFLPMIGSIVLLATTNLLCQEIASVPLLWVVPLTLYLLSFILCFDYPRLYRRSLFVPILGMSSVVAVTVVLFSVFVGVVLQIGALLTVCFAATMTCHGELERLKPAPRELTTFYLLLALGGALGGVLVALVAPRFFDGFYEFHIGLLASLAVLLVASYLPDSSATNSARPPALRLAGLWSGAILLMFAIAIVGSSLYYLVDPSLKPHQIFRERNEYGLLAVEEVDGYRKFVHGRIEHGGEWVSKTGSNFGSYYQPGTGVAIAIEAVRNDFNSYPEKSTGRGLNVGVVGLGVGGMLAWGNQGDSFTFFELDPAVERIAKTYFGYFKRTASRTEVIVGDGRIQLNRRAKELEQSKGGYQDPNKFDLLFLDAFSSDSIPIHLMTAECFTIYLENLKQEGVLIAHITNRFVDLRPVVYHHAMENGLTPVLIETKKTVTSPQTRWVLMTRNKRLLNAFSSHPNRLGWPGDMKPVRWTDDRSSLLDVLHWSDEIDWTPIIESRQRIQHQTTPPSAN